MAMREISDNDIFEATTLVYQRWSKEYDLLKAVKAEKDDGEEDWAEMHAIRLKNHTEAVAKWRGILDRLTAICPKIF